MKKTLIFALTLFVLNIILVACNGNSISKKATSVVVSESNHILSNSELQSKEVSTDSSITEEDKLTDAKKNNNISDSLDKENTLPQYFDYNGQLPEDMVSSVKYINKAKINKNMPEFIFEVYGTNVKSYGLTADETKYCIMNDYNKISRIVIKCEDISYKQELSFFETSTPNIPEYTYGFSLDDWNFDGYMDISLWMYPGGTLGNSPHIYWLWNNEEKKYVDNQEIEQLSEGNCVDLDKEHQLLIASYKEPDGFHQSYYKWEGKKIVLVKTDDISFDKPTDDIEKSRSHHIIKELINGKMQVTKEFYED